MTAPNPPSTGSLDTRRPSWGAGPSARYESIAAPFRATFDRIGLRAAARDLAHELPHQEIAWLREAGFTKVRLSPEQGGLGLTLPEFFALLIELSQADPNVTNALRSHAGLVEEVLNAETDGWRETWLKRLAEGALVGSGISEVGDNTLGTASTTLVRQGGHWLLNGQKYYTTGSLFADWIQLAASDANGEPIAALVPTTLAGVEIIDDWDGFGQRLSASGTARFTNVVLAAEHVKPRVSRFRYASAFFQLVHLAELSGIGRAASEEVASLVAQRRRVYGNRTNGSSVSHDPQILEVVGRVRSAAYAAGAITLKAAEALERAWQAGAEGFEGGDAARERTGQLADVEVGQAVTVVTDLILNATTVLFDALGASAAKESLGLDRHWRNARTISSHNPRIYHTRIVGDYAVNGTPPPGRGGVGIPAAQQKAA